MIELGSVLQLFVPMVFAGLACFVYNNQSGGSDTLGRLCNIVICNKGKHSFTTMLYEFISSIAGNGANFGAPAIIFGFRNLSTSFALLSGRFVPIVGG